MEKLVKLLECPICFNTLTLPVALCSENGHAICRNCKTSVNKCPYCKSQWSTKRSILFEQILQVLLQRCRYCGELIPADLKDEHERKRCKKKVIQCIIFSRGSRCPFFSPRDTLWEHLYDKHGRKMWKIYLDETVVVPIKNVFYTKNFSVLYEVGLRNAKRQGMIVLLRVYGDKEKKLLCFSANILNAEEDGMEEFVFRFTIRRQNKEIDAFYCPCYPISMMPEEPDRYPGGHPCGRGVVPKSNKIFLDPAEHYYSFCFKMSRP